MKRIEIEFSASNKYNVTYHHKHTTIDMYIMGKVDAYFLVINLLTRKQPKKLSLFDQITNTKISFTDNSTLTVTNEKHKGTQYVYEYENDVEMDNLIESLKPYMNSIAGTRYTV